MRVNKSYGKEVYRIQHMQNTLNNSDSNELPWWMNGLHSLTCFISSLAMTIISTIQTDMQKTKKTYLDE